jgi:hypothetical protein
MLPSPLAWCFPLGVPEYVPPVARQEVRRHTDTCPARTLPLADVDMDCRLDHVASSVS